MKENLSLIWTLFLDRFKVTIMLVILILFLGAAAYKSMPREATPSIDVPVANVITVWPGASPQDIEKLVTNKIEQEIKNLDNVKEYSSYSLSSLSMVTIEFEVDSNKLENMQKLREKIDNIKKDLPDSLPNDPEINELSFSDIPIASLTISGDFSWSELKQFSETIEDELKGIPKVKEVTVEGAPEDKIHILLNPIKLQSYDISVSEVSSAIRSAHLDMPLGQIDSEGEQIEITLQAELETIDEFLKLPIKFIDGAIIRLSDLAEVRREFDSFEIESLFSTGGKLKPSVLIHIEKAASQGNVITMVSEVIERVEKLKTQKRIPSSLSVVVTFNLATHIEESLSVLMNSGGQTLILIAFVMLFALGWRESLLASFAIPLSMFIGVTVLYLMGFSFNNVSLFALVISIGLLVDNAIIIVEGIAFGIYEKKLTPREAAIDTIRTFRWPIISGTLTTVFAFLPMLYFISGISGQFISVIPITVITVLFSALGVSLIFLPSLGVKFYEIFKPKKQKESNILKKIQKWYENKMKVILSSTSKVIGILAMSFGLLVYSLSLVITGKVPVEVFPRTDQVYFAAKVELPKGTQIEETRKLIEPIEKALLTFFEPQENGDIWFKNFILTVGKASGSVGGLDNSSLAEESVLGITVNLTEKEDREIESYNIAPLVREVLQKSIPDHAELTIAEKKGGPPTGAPIEIKLQGNNISHLEELTSLVKKGFGELDGLYDITDSQADRVLQQSWTLKRQKLSQFGITPSMLIEPLRTSVNGLTVISLTEGENEIDVDMKIDWKGDKKWRSPESLDILNRIPIKTPLGESISFGQIAESKMTSEVSSIRHLDGLRTIRVSAELENGRTASEYSFKLKEIVSNLDTLPGESVVISGDSEEGNRLIGEMANAMLTALFLIALVLIWQFNSYIQPVIILVLIPLSLTAVFIGFQVMGWALGFPTMIGIVALAGIIVNDAIVLIDQINHQHRDKGKDMIQGFIDAGKTRMQPIFLTSLTTVVGMIPLSLSSEMWRGLGFAIIFGMMFSTVLTLLLVPCIFVLIKRIKNWLKIEEVKF